MHHYPCPRCLTRDCDMDAVRQVLDSICLHRLRQSAADMTETTAKTMATAGLIQLNSQNSLITRIRMLRTPKLACTEACPA